MRARGLAGLAVGSVLLLLASGCEANRQTPAEAQAPSGATSTPAGPKPTRWPAAAAGGACQLLDYSVIEEILGTAFDVAAGGQQDATYTCVLQRTGTTVPDLSLAVTPTTATPTVFKNMLTPKGAAAVTGLGKVGYRMSVVGKAPRGPGIEIGWLSGNNRIIVLRYTLPPDAAAGAADAFAPKLIELAKKVDQTSV